MQSLHIGELLLLSLHGGEQIMMRRLQLGTIELKILCIYSHTNEITPVKALFNDI